MKPQSTTPILCHHQISARPIRASLWYESLAPNPQQFNKLGQLFSPGPTYPSWSTTMQHSPYPNTLLEIPLGSFQQNAKLIPLQQLEAQLVHKTNSRNLSQTTKNHGLQPPSNWGKTQNKKDVNGRADEKEREEPSHIYMYSLNEANNQWKINRKVNR